MIPPHLLYQIYIFFLEQNDCTPPKCGEMSEYTDSAHTEVEDLSSRYMNGSNVYDRCGHDTRFGFGHLSLLVAFGLWPNYGVLFPGLTNLRKRCPFLKMFLK